MAETPASPVPEPATGVPATTTAVPSEPGAGSEPIPGSEPAPPFASAAGPIAPAASSDPAAGSETPIGSEPAATAPANPTSPVAGGSETAVTPTPEPRAEEVAPPAATAAAASSVTVAPAPSPLPAVPPTPQAPEPPLAVEALPALDPGEPRVATTLEVPPLPSAAAGSALGSQGGEFELLMGKVTAWLERADLPGQWERLGGPLRGLGVLLGLLLVLKLYVALLDTLDDLLLLPRLLQLVGLIALLRFSVHRLTRSSDRQKVWDDWKGRWDAFRGS
ncbi:MAG: CAAD domain-containing protein [Cyanobacteriota bacterium]|nr:CAAD domain-containing protein [Cyanobacteriota bacterium]